MAISNGFDKQEAQTLLNLCIQLNGTGTDDPVPSPPAGWRRLFEGHDLGPFDNAWEFWRQGDENRYAIVVRGTVDDVGSILNDALASTMKSDGFLELGPEKRHLPLCFAPIEDGAVHLGFAWGAAILTFHKDKGILNQLLQVGDYSEIYITGHSQGAAIATLLHALFDHAARADSRTVFGDRLSRKRLQFKSYVFAQPKPGNWQFAQYFARIAGHAGRALCINNSRDWVPQVPFSIGLADDITGNPIPAALQKIKWVGRYLARTAELAGRLLRGLRRVVGEGIKDAVKQARTYLYEHIDHGLLDDKRGGNSASASLNYTQCGYLISLCGTKDEDRERADPFWQHHLATYRRLLDAQLPEKLP